MKIRALLLVAGLCLLGGLLWYDTRAVTLLQRRRNEARETAANAARLVTELKSLVAASAEPSEAHATSRRDLAAAAGSKVVKPTGTKPVPVPGARQIISRDPQLSARYLAMYGDLLDARFGLEFRRLGLSPQSQAQLRSTLEDMEAKRLAVAREAADQGLDPDDPSMEALQWQMTEPDVDTLKQLLTKDQLTELRSYRNEGPIVDLIQEFAGNASVPTVTTDQAQALLPILEAASQKNSEGRIGANTINVQAATNAASSVLNPEQLSIFSALLRKDQASFQLAHAGGG